MLRGTFAFFSLVLYTYRELGELERAFWDYLNFYRFFGFLRKFDKEVKVFLQTLIFVENVIVVQVIIKAKSVLQKDCQLQVRTESFISHYNVIVSYKRTEIEV